MAIITEQNRKWWVATAMSLVMVLLTLDFFGLAVCLPRIGEDLRASTGTLLRLPKWLARALPNVNIEGAGYFEKMDAQKRATGQLPPATAEAAGS